MLQEQMQNDVVVDVVDETTVVKVGHLPCIKRLMAEGVSGSCRVEAMTEVVKDLYRQEITKEAALPLIMECNSRNVPQLSEQEMYGIVYSVYRNGYAAIDCRKRFLKKRCNEESCRANGSPAVVVPMSVTGNTPSPAAAASASTVASVPTLAAVASAPDTGSAPIPVKQGSIITLDHLPEGWLKDYVRFVSELTEAPMQFHIATALAIVATALGRKVYIVEADDKLYANLYLLVVGESGLYHKSTAIRQCDKFLPEISQDCILKGDTMSLSAFREAFRRNPVRLLKYDEMATLFDNERKSGKGVMAQLPSLWDCPDYIELNLKNLHPDERIIFEPTLTILAASTPAWLDIKERDIRGGLWGRFIVIFADDSDRKIMPIRPPMDEAQRERLVQRLKAISSISAVYTWQEDARNCFNEIYNDLKIGFKKEPNRDLIGSYWARRDVHIKKLAMLFDACSPAPTFTITKNNVIRASVIMEYVTDYYREMLRQAAISKLDKDERKFIRILEAAYPGDVKRSYINYYGHIDAADIDRLAADLKAKDVIEEYEKPYWETGVKKTTICYRLKKQ